MIRSVIARSSKNMQETYSILVLNVLDTDFGGSPNVAWMPSAAFSAKGCVP